MNSDLQPSSSISASPGLMYFVKMQADDLDQVFEIETSVHPHPWTRGNFLDSLASGYEAWVLRDESGLLVGYFLVMLMVDEVHLLNVSVRADLQGRGIGVVLLDKVAALAIEHQMASVLLEVRPSNARALAVYERYGYASIARRTAYYPAANNVREDAIVMRLPL